MRSKVFMPGVEEGQLQRIKDASQRIDNTAGQKPEEASFWKRVQNPCKCQDAGPAHSDIDKGGKPFGAGNPQCVDKDSQDSYAPYQSQQEPPCLISQYNHTYRRIGSCNEDEYHHMIQLPQQLVDAWRNVQGVIDGAGRI